MNDPPRPSSLDYVLTYLQHIYPQHLLSTMMFRVTRSRFTAFKNWFIGWFVDQYDIDMSVAENPNPLSYKDFNSFFTRALRADARPITSDADAIVSPADGAISEVGNLDGGSLVQAKNRWYSIAELLHDDTSLATHFANGNFVTIYLSPRDYHRVHIPCDGQLIKMTYVPGRLFSVNQTTTRVLPRLFARNERVISIFDTAIGPMAVVMVGAIFVGSMETVWHGLVTPPHGQSHHTFDYPAGQTLLRGQELGRFNMGSTVIVLLPGNTVIWDAEISAGTSVQMGQTIGRRKLV